MKSLRKINVAAKTKESLLCFRSVVGGNRVSNHEYAVGCCRQVTSEELDIPADFGCASSRRRDHSCVLYCIEKNIKMAPFKSGRCSRVLTVELKTEKTSFAPEQGRLSSYAFASYTRATKKKKVQRKGKTGDASICYFKDPTRSSDIGALWQEIAYVLSETWTCIARVGAGEIDLRLVATPLLPQNKAEDFDAGLLRL